MKRMYPTLLAAILLIAGCHGDGNDPSNTFTAPVTEIVMPNVGPFGVTVSPDGTRAIVPMTGSYSPSITGNTIAVIDTATDQVLKTLTVGDRPQDVAFSEDGSRAYVTNSSSATLSVIDLSTLSVIDTISVGDPFESSTWYGTYPYGITIKDGKAYVTTGIYPGAADKGIVIVDVNPLNNSTYHTVVGEFDMTGNFTRGSFRPGTTEWITPRNRTTGQELAIYDFSNDTYLTSIELKEATGSTAHGFEDLAITPNGKYAYTALFTYGSSMPVVEVYVVDLEERKLIDILTINSGDNSAHGLAMSPDGLLVGVTSWNVGKVSWISTVTHTVVREDFVGGNPNEIAFTSDGAKVYVTNQASQNVSVIRLPSSHQLLRNMFETATMTPDTTSDLSWRMEELQSAVDSGNENMTGVFMNDVSIQMRYWSEQGGFLVGDQKDLTPLGAGENNLPTPVTMGGINANLQ